MHFPARRLGMSCHVARIAFVASPPEPSTRRSPRCGHAPNAGGSCLPLGKHPLAPLADRRARREDVAPAGPRGSYLPLGKYRSRCAPAGAVSSPRRWRPERGRVLLATWQVAHPLCRHRSRATVALTRREGLACQLTRIALVAPPLTPRCRRRWSRALAAASHRTREGPACQLARIALLARAPEPHPRRGRLASDARGSCLPLGKYRTRCAPGGAPDAGRSCLPIGKHRPRRSHGTPAAGRSDWPRGKYPPRRVLAAQRPGRRSRSVRVRGGLACHLARIAFIDPPPEPRRRHPRRMPDAGGSCLPLGKYRTRCTATEAARARRGHSARDARGSCLPRGKHLAGGAWRRARRGEDRRPRRPPLGACRRTPGDSSPPFVASLLDATGRPAHNARRKRRNRIAGREP